MFGSTPLSERPEWHLVHRANPILRSALLNEAASFSHLGLNEPFDAIVGTEDGPIGITYPQSLVTRLNDLDVGIEGAGSIRVPSSFAAEPGTEPIFDDGGDVAPSAKDRSEGSPEQGSQADLDEEADSDQDPFAALDARTQAHMLALVREFQRRQRHANLLVAGSLAAAVLLTLGGFMLVARLSPPETPKSEQPGQIHSTSITWQRPEREAMIAPNRDAKGKPLLIPAKMVTSPPVGFEDASSAQVILATHGRKLALAPLLDQRHARYVLLRGLPPEAELSAGERTGSGSWMVKDEDAQELYLAVGEAASGDYPIDIYLLDAGNAPQSRRTVILRVEPERPHVYSAGFSLSWANALLDAAAKTPVASETIAPAQSSVLLARAKALLAEGDIAGARLLLFHLAERGEGDATYELALTFDADMLARLGASGVESDPAIARGWYEQASQRGNVEAAERLKILASLPVSDPSD
jgi:hypothetical protein